MNTAILMVAAAAVVLLTIFLRSNRQQARSKLPFPPGPKPEWLLGNARQMPASSQWLTFANWGKQYGKCQSKQRSAHQTRTHRPHDAFPFPGGFVFARVFGDPFLILNSAQSAIDLLDRRSTIYSDRKDSVMVNELYVSHSTSPALPHAHMHK